MDMPKPSAQHVKLNGLAGTWSGDETIHPGPMGEGGTSVGKMKCKMLEGFYLVMDYEQKRGGKVCFRGHGVYTYNAQGKSYSMHWFDSLGFDPPTPVPGTFKGNQLSFQHATPEGQMRFRYTLKDAANLDFEMATSADGKKWQKMLTGSYARQGATAAESQGASAATAGGPV